MLTEARTTTTARFVEGEALTAPPDDQRVHQVACQAITDTLTCLGYHLTDPEVQLITQTVIARIDYTLWVRGLIWAHHTLAERVALQRRFYEHDLATDSREPISDLERFRRHCRESRIDGMELALDHLTWQVRQHIPRWSTGDTSARPSIPACGVLAAPPAGSTAPSSPQSE